MNDVVSISLAPLVYEEAPLRRKIAGSLRRAIEIGQLKPGDRLVETELCRQLNVSRTSLREALRELQTEKLVSRVARGLIVTEISERDAVNIYRVRASLEGLVAEQFAEIATESDINALVTVLDRLEWAYKSGNFEDILAEKRKFYDVICAGAQNEIVRDMLGRLNSRISQLRSSSRADWGRGVASLEELRELAHALIARKPKDARIAAIRHVEAAAKAAARHRHPVPQGDAAEISVAQGGPVLRPRGRASGQKRVP
jgi:DNA-binding GntR family transcriptional regulator